MPNTRPWGPTRRAASIAINPVPVAIENGLTFLDSGPLYELRRQPGVKFSRVIRAASSVKIGGNGRRKVVAVRHATPFGIAI
jgi:hypothetical protein